MKKIIKLYKSFTQKNKKFTRGYSISKRRRKKIQKGGRFF